MRSVATRHSQLECLQPVCACSYALFRNILRQEIGWFDVHNGGELSNRLIQDLGKNDTCSLHHALVHSIHIDKIKDGIKYVHGRERRSIVLFDLLS